MLANPKQFLDSLPNRPGVYQMYDSRHKLLYVGKAKNLKKRLSSYFRAVRNQKTEIFMAQVEEIKIILTPDENNAWLLEGNLIKSYKPRYNILFKDDKSFPYLKLSKHEFPRLSIYRGKIDQAKANYFGPFPDRKAVSFIFKLLQKIFKLRVCQDSLISNRSRACMLYQLKLCSAPCVCHIDHNAYHLQVELAKQFLSNKSDQVVARLTKLMDLAAAKLDYEQAANYRDQIINIRKIQSPQAMTSAKGNYDVIAVVAREEQIAVSILLVRNGAVIGNQTILPKVYTDDLSLAGVLNAFLSYYYLQNDFQKPIPDKILLNLHLPDKTKLAKIFSARFGKKLLFIDQARHATKQLVTMAEDNGYNALRINPTTIKYKDYLLDFQQTFGLAAVPKRLEGFDVSHSLGEVPVASCVVFNEIGAEKTEYRKFNIKTAKHGDDYQALLEALKRRYVNQDKLPEVIIIDGGRGQFNLAAKILNEFDLQQVLLIAIAKGKERKVGLEELYVKGRKLPLILSPDSLTLRLIQQVRDEAHRFAVEYHRRRMINLRRQSCLIRVAGIGKVKRARLLKYFGGLPKLQNVSVGELAKVEGIGYSLAKRVYDDLHA